MASNGTFMGKPMVKFGEMSVMDYDWTEGLDIDFDVPECKDDEDPDEHDEKYSAHDAWYAFVELLEKNKDDVISMHLDG